MKMSHGSVCLPTHSGRKDDLAVILPELARTGSLLKQCPGLKQSEQSGDLFRFSKICLENFFGCCKQI